MSKSKRPHMLKADANKFEAWFNIEEITRPQFQLLFSRASEVLEHFFKEDKTGVMETFKKQWAMEEANVAHDRGVL